jgi:hypothetical protein
MPHNPDRLLELAAELQKPYERYLKWSVIVDRWDRGKGSALAAIIQSLPRTEKESFTSLESRALASEEWKKYLERWHQSDKERVRAKVEFDTKKWEHDSLQSVLAYERDSMRRLG